MHGNSLPRTMTFLAEVISERQLQRGGSEGSRMDTSSSGAMYLPLIYIFLAVTACIMCAGLPRLLGRCCGSRRCRCAWTWSNNDGTWCCCLSIFQPLRFWWRRRSHPRDDLEVEVRLPRVHADRMRRFGPPEDDVGLPPEALDGFFRHGVLAAGRFDDGGHLPAQFAVPARALDGAVRHERPPLPQRLGDAPGLMAYRQMNSARLSVAALTPEPMDWYEMLSMRERRMVLERALACEPYQVLGERRRKQSGEESPSTAASTSGGQHSDSSRIGELGNDDGQTAEVTDPVTAEEQPKHNAASQARGENFDNEFPPRAKDVAEDSSVRICAICLGEFEEDHLVNCPIKCPHIFHRDCLLPWLVKHGQCPCCRAAMVDGDDWGRGALRLSIRGGVGGLGSLLSDSVRMASERALEELGEDEEESVEVNLGSGHSDDSNMVDVDLGSMDGIIEELSGVDLESTQHGEWRNTNESEDAGTPATPLATMTFGEFSDADLDDPDEDAEMVDIELGPG